MESWDHLIAAALHKMIVDAGVPSTDGGRDGRNAWAEYQLPGDNPCWISYEAARCCCVESSATGDVKWPLQYVEFTDPQLVSKLLAFVKSQHLPTKDRRATSSIASNAGLRGLLITYKTKSAG